MLQKIYKQFQSSPFGGGGSTQHGRDMNVTARHVEDGTADDGGV
jgi:hypothetical protein